MELKDECNFVTIVYRDRCNCGNSPIGDLPEWFHKAIRNRDIVYVGPFHAHTHLPEHWYWYVKGSDVISGPEHIKGCDRDIIVRGSDGTFGILRSMSIIRECLMF